MPRTSKTLSIHWLLAAWKIVNKTLPPYSPWAAHLRLWLFSDSLLSLSLPHLPLPLDSFLQGNLKLKSNPSITDRRSNLTFFTILHYENVWVWEFSYQITWKLWQKEEICVLEGRWMNYNEVGRNIEKLLSYQQVGLQYIININAPLNIC